MNRPAPAQAPTIKPFIATLALALALILTGPFTLPSSASSLNDFNLIALGDLTGTSEVEGRVVVFGNVSGNSKNFAVDSGAVFQPVSTQGLARTDGLIVGGQVSGDPIQVNNGGVRIRGSSTGSQINNADYVTYGDATVSSLLSGVTLDIAQTLAMLDGLTTNSFANLSDMNQAVFTLTPGQDNIAVFDADASLFNRNGTFDLAGNLDTDLIVIRIDTAGAVNAGNALNVKTNEFGQNHYQSRIIWYLPDATDVSFINGLGGALIAPNANLTLGNPIEGTVVVNNITLGSEIHLPTLDTPPVTPVPEPSTSLLLGLGLALISLAVSRRQKAHGH